MRNEETRRLDAALVERGLAGSREKAKELIAAGQVKVNGKTAVKPAQPVTAADTLTCEAGGQRYVGRGGYKLEKALAVSGRSPRGLTALDVGASTGGFTDCLLQNGAARVLAVDVGHGQLHASLRRDPRVVCLEGIDIRNFEEIQPFLSENPVLFCTIDVSFISVKRILPAVLACLKDGTTLVCLIKPQFEAGRQAVGKNGVVRDARAHCRVLREVCVFFVQHHCRLENLDYSPITGGEGNIEYLTVWTYLPDACLPAGAFLTPDVDAVVKKAQAALKKKSPR